MPRPHHHHRHHDMSVAQHAQRIIEIRDGEIIADRANPNAPAYRAQREASTGSPRQRLAGGRDRFSSVPHGAAGDERPSAADLPDHARHHHRHRLGSVGGGAGQRLAAADPAEHQRARHQHHRRLSRPWFRRHALGPVQTLKASDADALAKQSYVDSATPAYRPRSPRVIATSRRPPRSAASASSSSGSRA